MCMCILYAYTHTEVHLVTYSLCLSLSGTPPQRKTALRQLTDKAMDFGAGPLFNQILPLLMSPTLEDQVCVCVCVCVCIVCLTSLSSSLTYISHMHTYTSTYTNTHVHIHIQHTHIHTHTLIGASLVSEGDR